MKPVRSREQFRRRYFPADWERQRIEKMTPREAGAEIARVALRAAKREQADDR